MPLVGIRVSQEWFYRKLQHQNAGTNQYVPNYWQPVRIGSLGQFTNWHYAGSANAQQKAELFGYESTIRAWVKYNTKGEPNTESHKAARARAVAWMTPIFAAISEANTVTDKQASLQG